MSEGTLKLICLLLISTMSDAVISLLPMKTLGCPSNPVPKIETEVFRYASAGSTCIFLTRYPEDTLLSGLYLVFFSAPPLEV